MAPTSQIRQPPAGPTQIGLVRRLSRGPTLRRLRFRILGLKPVRRALTRRFTCGRVALGERNSYSFPLGWITVDWRDADFSLWFAAQSKLPFSDASQRLIYSAHVMEHLEDPALARLLAETYRILAPGGAMRIEVPDAETLIAAYRANDRRVLDYFRSGRQANLCRRLGMSERYLEDHLTVLGEIANYIDYDTDSGHVPVYASRESFAHELAKGLDSFNDWAQRLKTPTQRQSGGHANALTFAKMHRMLRDAGFSDVRRAAFGETAIPGLRLGRGIRRVYDAVPESPARVFYSLYIDAFK